MRRPFSPPVVRIGPERRRSTDTIVLWAAMAFGVALAITILLSSYVPTATTDATPDAIRDKAPRLAAFHGFHLIIRYVIT